MTYFYTDDLSFKAVASQSKIAPGQPIPYAASSAVDREIFTCTRADEIGRTAPDKTTWWKVDLNGTFNIFNINILFKNYKNYGMYHFNCTHSESCYLYASWIVLCSVSVWLKSNLPFAPLFWWSRGRSKEVALGFTREWPYAVNFLNQLGSLPRDYQQKGASKRFDNNQSEFSSWVVLLHEVIDVWLFSSHINLY